MKIHRILPIVFLVIGIISLGFGSFSMITKDDDTEKKKENKEEENQNNELMTEEDKKEVEKFLNEKYDDNFEVVKLVTTFCLANSETNLYLTSPCTDKTIRNKIYEVKDNNDIHFYVKSVKYDENQISISEEDKASQSVGFYDTYVSYIMADKLSTELETEYKKIFGAELDVKIYEGIGIENISYDNAYQYLENENTKEDKNLSIENFALKYSGFDNDLGLHIIIDADLTKDNVQEMVKKLTESDLLNGRNFVDIDEIILQFKNGNRYIEYDYESFIDIKVGENVYEAFNDELYDKTIVVGSGYSSNGITYDEFMALDKSSFNF